MDLCLPTAQLCLSCKILPGFSIYRSLATSTDEQALLLGFTLVPVGFFRSIYVYFSDPSLPFQQRQPPTLQTLFAIPNSNAEYNIFISLFISYPIFPQNFRHFSCVYLIMPNSTLINNGGRISKPANPKTVKTQVKRVDPSIIIDTTKEDLHIKARQVYMVFSNSRQS